MPPSLLPLTSHSVAVIGAGPAGLVAARELRREGHKVVVFERSDQIGGTWVYTSQTEPDPLSLDPNRPIIHTSLFESLRTNLPRESMGFKDFPFVAKEGKFRDRRRFPGHREVLEYLKEFAREFGIEEVVRFESEVVNVGLVEGDNKKWRVKYKVKGSDVGDEVFDAVVVCVGHYTEPRIAEIPGISSWPGKQIHSHNYRIPEPFTDQVIVLIGSATSSDDISREIAKVAKEVHIVSRSVAADTYEKLPGYDNMWLHSMIEGAHEDGTVAFLNERRVVADVIIHCTGYKFHFPFLQIGDIVTVDDNRVGPLYKHVFPPALAPSLSFVGVPWKVLLFPLFEIQSKWIAGTLSGRIQLPSKEETMEDVRAFYLNLEASNTPKRYTHKMDYSYVDYGNWLAVQCGCPCIEEWRRQLFIDALQRNLMWPDSYRDECVDEQLIAEAHKDFSGYTSKVIPEA